MAEFWPTLLFWLLAVAACASAVAVVAAKNIVRCAVFLLFALLSVAGLFFLLGAAFVGTVQLAVYVGGILILVIFGVMLTAQAPLVSIETKSGDWVVAAFVGTLLLALVLVAIGSYNWSGPVTRAKAPDQAGRKLPTATDLGLGLVGIRTDHPEGRPAIGYLLPFEIASVHLLVVLIGAAYLARAKRKMMRRG